MQLFYSTGSCALASHIALEEAGAAYTATRIHFAKEEQRSPAFLAINPKGRVPALVTAQGVLTETPAILAYIAQSYPQAALAPLDDPYAFAQIQSYNSYLCSTVHVAHAHRGRGYRWADDEAAIAEMKRKAPETVAAAFTFIEDTMPPSPWAMGGTYIIADPYLFTLSGWIEVNGLDYADFPRIAAHRELMKGRPAVQTVLAQENVNASS